MRAVLMKHRHTKQSGVKCVALPGSTPDRKIWVDGTFGAKATTKGATCKV